jgi:hypothetical protein
MAPPRSRLSVTCTAIAGAAKLQNRAMEVVRRRNEEGKGMERLSIVFIRDAAQFCHVPIVEQTIKTLEKPASNASYSKNPVGQSHTLMGCSAPCQRFSSALI